MSAFGTLLKELRQGKRISQLEFSLESEVSAKHISFLETGRAKPSKDMVLRLARMLQADLASTNRLLAAAGYSQIFTVNDIHSPALRMVKEALQHLLRSHMPFPALVFDGQYQLIMANEATQHLLKELMLQGARVSPAPNIILSMLDENAFKPFIHDWEQIACHMLQRVYHEHLSGPLRDEQNQLLEQALALPGIPKDWKSRNIENLDMPAVPFTVRVKGQSLRFFSTIASIGTPLDVTAQSLRVEHFFPMDEATKSYWQRLYPA